MSERTLKESLDALRVEIGRIAASHPEDGAHLEQLFADLEHASSGGAVASVVAKAREAVLLLEVKHPKAAAIVNDVLLSLSNVGM